MKLRKCETCKNGVPMKDGEVPFVMCALLPPKYEQVADEPAKWAWVRPPMSILGWCGQHRFSLLRWLGYGSRA